MLNAICGEERSIVCDMSGTTRDAVDTEVTLPSGQKLTLIDTAGIRKRAKVADSKDGPESLSVDRALRAMKRADVAVMVIDASEGVTQQVGGAGCAVAAEGVSSCCWCSGAADVGIGRDCPAGGRCRGTPTQILAPLPAALMLLSLSRCSLPPFPLFSLCSHSQDFRLSEVASNEGSAVVVVVNKWDQVDEHKWTEETYAEEVRAQLRHVSWATVICTTASEGAEREHRRRHWFGGSIALEFSERVRPAQAVCHCPARLSERAPSYCIIGAHTEGTGAEKLPVFVIITTPQAPEWRR